MNAYKNIAWISLFLISSFCSQLQAMNHPWLESYKTNNTPDFDTSSLSHFYNQPSHIWLDNQQLTNQAHDALDFISGSSKHGLDPTNYHFAILDKLDPSQDSLSAQQFDLLLTDGLLKLIHDLTVGQLQSTIADPDWFIPQASFDNIAFLQQALLSTHLKTELNSLIPTTSEYHKLTEVLARYQSFVGRGGWSEIPAMPLISPGDRHRHLSLVRKRLAFDDNVLVLSTKNNVQYYDPFLEQAVRHFQKKHGLKIDGIIGSETRKAMNISAQDRLQQIKVTLERHRWLPNNLGKRYLIINLANYKLKAINNGSEELAMRVIVGRKSRQTPSFTSQLNHLVFNPYWNVPRKLAKLDLLPKQQQDFNYFYQHDIRVFTIENGHRVEHDPYLINWQSITRSNFPYTLRQDPGDRNALGKLKFLFPNQWSIYLHDTSHRELFSETMRSISSGCIRVEDPVALANFSIAKPTSQQIITDMIDSKQNRGLKLTAPLSIYAVYITVWVDGDDVIFSPDVYQRDKRMAKLL